MTEPAKQPEPRIDSWRLLTDSLRANATAGFDELVVGNWFHIERMDHRVWWLGIGDKSWNIRIGRDGRPTVFEQ